MWILLIGLGLLLASGAGTSRAPGGVKGQKFQAPYQCSDVQAVAGRMAAHLAESYPKGRYAKGWLDAMRPTLVNVVADWTYWELSRQSGTDATEVPELPWAQPGTAEFWRGSGPDSISRRTGPDGSNPTKCYSRRKWAGRCRPALHKHAIHHNPAPTGLAAAP